MFSLEHLPFEAVRRHYGVLPHYLEAEVHIVEPQRVKGHPEQVLRAGKRVYCPLGRSVKRVVGVADRWNPEGPSREPGEDKVPCGHEFVTARSPRLPNLQFVIRLSLPRIEPKLNFRKFFQVILI